MTHLTEHDLLAVLDGGQLNGLQRGHLQTCVSCKGRMQWLVALRRRCAALPPLESPGIHPGSTATRRRRELVQRTAAAVAAVAVLSLGVAVWSAGRLGAQQSDLRFVDDVILAGSHARVEYMAAPWLAGDDSLVVRAVFRTAADRRYETAAPVVAAGVLFRGGSGRFSGTLEIPPDAVYGALAVETVDGEQVDANLGRLWEVLIGGLASHRAASQQRVNDLLGRDWVRATRAQRELAEAYPFDPEAWKDVYFLDLEVTPLDGSDSLRFWHRERLRALDARYRGTDDITGDIAAGLMWYGLGVQDTAVAVYWKHILLARFPTAPRAVEQRVAEFQAGDTTDRLLQMERLWDEVGPAHSFLPQSAAIVALRSGDANAAARWLERYAGMRPEIRLWAAVNLTRFPETRARAVTELREEVLKLQEFGDAARPLNVSRTQFRRESAGAVAEAGFQLGRALLSLPDSGEAEAAFSDAVRHDWHTGALMTLSRLRVARDDRSGAVEFLARAAADPASGLDADSARALLGVAYGETAWRVAVQEARRDLAERTLAGAQAIPLPDISLSDSLGRRLRLAQLIGNGPAVVAFWSPYCGPSIDLLPELEALSVKLTSAGATMILVTTEPLDSRVATLLRAAGVTMTPYADASRGLALAVHQSATPALYVVDAQAILRFPLTSMARIERQIAAVAFETSPGTR